MPRTFLITLVAVNAGLTLAGAVYAARAKIPAATAAPIVGAFLLQISFYLVPGFPEIRRRIEARFSPVRLGALLVGTSAAPYVLYSAATGVFRFSALFALVALACVPAFVFVLWPTQKRGLTWQDAAAGGAVAAGVLSGLFQQIYLSPAPGLRLEAMGRIMIFGLGVTAFLSLRRLEGSGFQLRTSAVDWKIGLRQFAFFLPLGLAIGWGLGFFRLRDLSSAPLSWWMFPFVAAGVFLGMYAIVGLLEEFFFRGVLQNLAGFTLGGAVRAQALASVIFGLSHLPFRDFPNWRFALLATVAGWFYGQAYRKSGNVVAPSIAHALTNTVWQLLFVS